MRVPLDDVCGSRELEASGGAGRAAMAEPAVPGAQIGALQERVNPVREVGEQLWLLGLRDPVRRYRRVKLNGGRISDRLLEPTRRLALLAAGDLGERLAGLQVALELRFGQAQVLRRGSQLAAQPFTVPAVAPAAAEARHSTVLLHTLLDSVRLVLGELPGSASPTRGGRGRIAGRQRRPLRALPCCTTET